MGQTVGILLAVMGIIAGIFSFLLERASADVVIFKDGRKMKVEKAWVEGGEVKARVYGGIVGYPMGSVERIEEDQLSVRLSECGFKFDKWLSGMSIDEAMKVAETYDVPIHRVGLISGGKRFNPDVSRKYADTAGKFYYKDNLLGKWSTVTLSFTPVSKLLWSVGINWSGIPSKSDFKNDVESLLSEKYGKPKGRGRDLLQGYRDAGNKVSKLSPVTVGAIGHA